MKKTNPYRGFGSAPAKAPKKPQKQPKATKLTSDTDMRARVGK